MITLAELTLAVARTITPENIVTGSATAGTTTSLTDSANITQAQQYFDKGILWILSGDHAGKVLHVTGHNGNKLSFAAIDPAIATGVRYAVARNLYPYQQIRSAIMQALDETHVESVDETLTGDGETLEFTLPAGVRNVKHVYTLHPTDTTGRYDSISNHWKERDGKLKFDYGYAPYDDYKIRIIWRDKHYEMVDHDDEINPEINTEWLKHKAAEYLLNWGMGRYGAQAEYRIEERMGLTMERLRRLTPRLGSPDIVIRSGGM